MIRKKPVLPCQLFVHRITIEIDRCLVKLERSYVNSRCLSSHIYLRELMKKGRTRLSVYVRVTMEQVTSKVIRGEQTRYSMFCPSDHAQWLGPMNQTFESDRKKYELKISSLNTLELIIHQLTFDDQGEYICRDNRTEEILRRYQLSIGTMKMILLPFILFILIILLLWPLFCCLGRKYSGLGR